MYIREAHPTDGRQAPANIRENILIQDPKTIEERRQVAQDFAAQFKVSVPILVDSMDDQAEKAYSGWPDRIYVIDAAGKIAYKGGPGPGGFRPDEIPPVLERLLGSSPVLVSPLEPSSASRIPRQARDRFMGMLTGMGVSQEDADQILRAVDRKSDAYREVARARMSLMSTLLDQSDPTRAVADFREALSKYEWAVLKIDAELDSAIGYSKKPTVSAALTALGFIGTAPSSPLGAIMGVPGAMIRDRF